MGCACSYAVAITLSGAVLVCPPAHAQETGVAAEERIDGVFGLVPGNPLDLALPLTRRALARRLNEGEVKPLPYAPAEPSAPAAETEQGSTDAEVEEDEDVARMPRPRPLITNQEASSQEPAPAPEFAPAEAAATEAAKKSGAAAFDLVAGAPVPEPAVPVAKPAEPDGAALAAVSPPQAQTAPADLVAGKDCLAPEQAADRDQDFKRNAAALSAPGFCIAQEKFRERRRNWTVQTVDSGRAGPLWIVIHDDENNSFDNAVWALAAYGGRLITLDTGGKRNQDGVDPNRNFSDDEISCRKLGKAATPRFSTAFRKLIDPSQPVIALHNNHADGAPTGGLGHVSMKTVPRDMRTSASGNPDGPLASDYALVLLTASEPAGAAVDARMAELSGKGLNVVLETVRANDGDCSLSNYAALLGEQMFINVTVHHDEAEKQRKIVEAVLAGTPALSAAR